MFRAPGVPDNALTFAFCMIRLVAGTLLIRDVARTAARRPPRWAVGLAMLVFALANPTPFTLARAGIYEAAIMGGVAFTVAGLWFGYRALGARRAGAASATAWLAAASLSLGLAGGTRLSLIPTIAALAVLTGFGRLRHSTTAAPVTETVRASAPWPPPCSPRARLESGCSSATTSASAAGPSSVAAMS